MRWYQKLAVNLLQDHVNQMKMLTVLDFNITHAEKEYIGCTTIDFLKISEQSNNYFLASLFYMRGDKVKAAEFADKLPPQVKNDFYRIVTHP